MSGAANDKEPQSRQDPIRLLVIGGGAAGFFCAVNAARMNRQLQVIIAEKTGKLLSKVKVSGGGRCNLTHEFHSIEEWVGQYPRGARLLKKSLHHFSQQETLRWFQERGVVHKTEEDGRIFPSTNSSQTIIDCLIKEASHYGVQVLQHREVTAITRQDPETGKRFHVQFSSGQTIDADFICLCCGGLPKPEQYGWIRRLGLQVETPVPSLFTFNLPDHPIRSLQGVSVRDAAVSIQGTRLKERGPLLITHWGLSGPAILRLSAWGARVLESMKYSFSIRVNWVPNMHEQTMGEKLVEMHSLQGARKISGHGFGLPERLWEFLMEQARIAPDTRWSELKAEARNRLVVQLCSMPLDISGKTTFKEEFVTAGGITLSSVNPQTMESREIPGLFAAGEVLDVDGITGGFNFQHAWTSGWVAASAVAAGAQAMSTAHLL